MIFLIAACQTTMSVEEAKRVTASFVGASFVPPPRSSNDITAILDQQRLADPALTAAARAEADRPAPNTTNPGILADFYLQRGRAAAQIGRARQELDDLNEAARWAARGSVANEAEILNELSTAEAFSGSFSRSLDQMREAISKAPGEFRRLIPLNAKIARIASVIGDVDTAEFGLSGVRRAYDDMRRMNLPPASRGTFDGHLFAAEATVAEAKGQLQEAEKFWRQSVDGFDRGYEPSGFGQVNPDRARARLVGVLLLQRRLLEAENEARAALLSILSKRGRFSTETANVLRVLATVLAQQGRYAEAEKLIRATIDIYQKSGSSPDSDLLAVAHDRLAATLIAQGRWQEALAEYEIVDSAMSRDPEALERFLRRNVNWGLSLLHNRRADRAAEVFRSTLEYQTQLLGPIHPTVAEIRGLLAMALTAQGDRRTALKEFAGATAILLTRSVETDDESATRGMLDQRLTMILESYMGLLAETRGTPLEAELGVPPAAEAFRLAEIARGRSVQRALDASAARAAAHTPVLADMVRREQDAQKQLNALSGMLSNALSQPTDQRMAKVAEQLRSQITVLTHARQALIKQIAADFPAYHQLINPPPVTIEEAQAILRSGEAWITTYVAQDRTFVWAIPAEGPVAFAAAPLGEKTLGDRIATLRKALDPNVQTLEDIPEFDMALAHQLYAALLEPVAAGWQKAESLLVVPHGPLGQLPFALLPTKPTKLSSEPDALFSKYRASPWLVRTHAATMLPSVASLRTLRALPPGDPKRRPFVGFGDPFFNRKQASAAMPERDSGEFASVATRGVPIKLRSSPRTRNFDSSQIAMLPRLPETADELRSIALAMNADLTKDVFVGERANEEVIKSLDLFGFRVLAFATHGLVPGDIDGLTQPALALSPPEVAKVGGDGLLTMEEILGLRLSADWVVLSACNTASGNGSGAEAVSGLGRAFFYAGARALLVSHWPVETNSARELTTDLFRRQSKDPTLTRAGALQQTMIAMLDGPGYIDVKTRAVVFSYAHPIFWAPFVLVGDGG
jgi:CHAT domain-containing protein